MTRTVTQIPATRALHTGTSLSETKTRKVAGYARVSTDHDDQITSYHAQVDYYTNYITNHTGWQLVKVYTDEGITGTSTKHRAGFQAMVADALAGKIDLIITKSVSRFARNTADSLTTVRSLKEKGVEVYFEKENIWTFDAKGELLITIMSSLAQEESRSISENVTWGHRKRFADGKVTVPYSRFLGYDKGKGGNLVVNPQQAALVRRIFGMFLEGMSVGAIARTLSDEPDTFTAAGTKNWSSTTIRSILRNEKYKGDALLQKFYSRDFLSKKQIKNQGEVPQYYVTANHEAIINPAVWEFVNGELARHSKFQRSSNRTRPFSSTLVCGDCGSFFGAKTWHAGSKYEKVIWRCGHKYSGEQKCTTGHIDNERLEELFMEALRHRFDLGVDADLELDLMKILDTSDLKIEAAGLVGQIEKAAKQLEDLISRNARVAQDQDEYQRAFDAAHQKHQNLLEAHGAVLEQIQDKQHRLAAYRFFKQELEGLDGAPLNFTPYLRVAMLESGTVATGGEITFVFRDGSEQIFKVHT